MAYPHGKKWVVCRRLPTGKNEKTSFNTQEEAELYEAQGRVDKKLSPGKVRAKLSKDETFSDAARSYLRGADLRPISKRNRLICLNAHILPELGGVFLKEFTKTHLDRMVSVLREAELSVSTINLYMALVMSILRYANEEGVMQIVPKWKKLKGGGQSFQPPSQADLKKMLEVAEGHIRRIILLGAHTGIRPGPVELYSLQWSQVDFEAGIIYVRSAKKREAGPIRVVPLHPELIEEMREWQKDGHPHIIHQKGKPITCCIRKGWNAMLERAGVRRMRPYDLRHYFVTTSLGSGGVLKAVSELAGHSTPNVTLNTYQHVSNDLRRQAINGLPSLLG